MLDIPAQTAGQFPLSTAAVLDVGGIRKDFNGMPRNELFHFGRFSIP